MHEMLGNQYFMIRNFKEAQNEFEIAITQHPNNHKIKKKLIVCYTQNGKTEKALELFYIVARIDINIIFNTDVVKDDCPCPELIPLIENHEKLNTNSLDYFLTMGILWAFCDKYRSLEFFSKAKELSPNNEIISSILNIFHNHFNDIEFVN